MAITDTSRSSPRIRTLVVFLLIALGLGPLWRLLREPSEPIYDGRTLSRLFVESEQGTGTPLGPAFQSLGTNAIPTLLRWLHKTDPRLVKTLRPHAERFRILRFCFTPAEQWRQRAQQGFTLLGTNVVAALPALAAGLDSPDDGVRQRTANVLYLLAFHSVHAGLPRSAFEPAIPALMRGLSDRHPNVREFSAIALGNIRDHAATVVPALIAAVQRELGSGGTPLNLPDLLEAVQKFGPDASNAVPIVEPLLRYADEPVRTAATNALRAIQVPGPHRNLP